MFSTFNQPSLPAPLSIGNFSNSSFISGQPSLLTAFPISGNLYLQPSLLVAFPTYKAVQDIVYILLPPGWSNYWTTFCKSWTPTLGSKWPQRTQLSDGVGCLKKNSAWETVSFHREMVGVTIFGLVLSILLSMRWFSSTTKIGWLVQDNFLQIVKYLQYDHFFVFKFDIKIVINNPRMCAWAD